MRNYIGFVSGIILGVAASIIAQQIFWAPQRAPAPADPERGSLASRRQDQQLSNARERITELEDQLAGANQAEPGFAAAAEEAPAAPTERAADKAASFIQMMMSFRDDDAIRKIDTEVARLTGILNLTENQQAVVRDALMKRFNEQKEAGVRLMTGKASLGDLIAADEHNFTTVDAIIQPILDGSQLEIYQEEQVAREQKRIENKTKEELDTLGKCRRVELRAAGLSVGGACSDQCQRAARPDPRWDERRAIL